MCDRFLLYRVVRAVYSLGAKITLSPSLSFWRRLAGLFIRKLRLTADIEEQINEIVIPLAEEELSGVLETVPLMPGGGYVHEEVLVALWEALHEIFFRKIAAYGGSVAEFVKEYGPDVHLAEYS